MRPARRQSGYRLEPQQPRSPVSSGGNRGHRTGRTRKNRRSEGTPLVKACGRLNRDIGRPFRVSGADSAAAMFAPRLERQQERIARGGAFSAVW